MKLNKDKLAAAAQEQLTTKQKTRDKNLEENCFINLEA